MSSKTCHELNNLSTACFIIFLVCDGNIELQSIDGAVSLSFDVKDLRNGKITEKTKHCGIDHKNRLQCKIKPNNIEMAKASGNCYWQLCSRYRGDNCRAIANIGSIANLWPFPIKRVVLTECRNCVY